MSLFVLGPIAIDLESLIGDLLEYLDRLRSQWDRDFAGAGGRILGLWAPTGRPFGFPV